MDKRPMKTVGESRTEQVQIVLPGHSNGDGRAPHAHAPGGGQPPRAFCSRCSPPLCG